MLALSAKAEAQCGGSKPTVNPVSALQPNSQWLLGTVDALLCSTLNHSHKIPQPSAHQPISPSTPRGVRLLSRSTPPLRPPEPSRLLNSAASPLLIRLMPQVSATLGIFGTATTPGSVLQPIDPPPALSSGRSALQPFSSSALNCLIASSPRLLSTKLLSRNGAEWTTSGWSRLHIS